MAAAAAPGGRGAAKRGTTIVRPQPMQGPLWPANSSSTRVSSPQWGQAKGRGMGEANSEIRMANDEREHSYFAVEKSLTIWTYWRARDSIFFRSPEATTLGSTRELPMPRAQAPQRRNSAAVSRLTPPVGIRRMCGRGPCRAFRYLGPVISEGKIF